MMAARTTPAPYLPDQKQFVPLLLSQAFLIVAVAVGHLALLQAVLMVCVDIFLVVVSMLAYSPTPHALQRRLIWIVQSLPVIFLILMGMVVFVVHPPPSERDSGRRLLSTIATLLHDEWTRADFQSWAIYLLLMFAFPLVAAARSVSGRRWWYANMIAPMTGTVWALLFASLLAGLLGANFLAKDAAPPPVLTVSVLLFFAVVRAATIWYVQGMMEPDNFEENYQAFVSAVETRD